VELETLRVDVADGVATVTLNRPEALNSFNSTMCEEVSALWQRFRTDDDVRVVVLTGAGDRAFCAGIDRDQTEFAWDPLTYEDPGRLLGPKSQELWKPVISVVNGLACGGAFYFLGESDVIIAADHATFFDPHVTYSMVAVYEPLLLLSRMPFGEVLRMALAGAHERMSARRALEVGFVTEVLPLDDAMASARRLAAAIASAPPRTIQSTLRTLWAARNLTPRQANDLGNMFLHLATTVDALAEGQEAFSAGARIEPKIR
jgi:enoyl-CoA hydratase/carnithine racemase